MIPTTLQALPVAPPQRMWTAYYLQLHPKQPHPPEAPEMAALLAKLSLPAMLETAAAALSHYCRDSGMPDLVHTPEVADAIDATLEGSTPPLTLRCVNTTRLTLARAISQEHQDQAAMALLTAGILREAQPGRTNLPGLTWRALLQDKTPLARATRELATDLAPADRAKRLYPTGPERLDAHLHRTLAAGGLPPLYAVESGPDGIYQDMCTAGLLAGGTAPSPGAEERVAFLDSLGHCPLP